MKPALVCPSSDRGFWTYHPGRMIINVLNAYRVTVLYENRLKKAVKRANTIRAGRTKSVFM
jgi:hypothetical protein